MAGMPQIVILKAQKLLKKLRRTILVQTESKSEKDEMQMSFFNLDDPSVGGKEEILNLDINITPMEGIDETE
jgi:DNA mismatch repair protein MutS